MEVKSPEKKVEYKTIFNEDGTLKFVKKEDSDKGKIRKSSGLNFESRVRRDLEDKGWIVDKWSNNIDLEDKKVVPVKRKTIPSRFGSPGIKENPFIRYVSTIGTGFPDFIAFQKSENKYDLIGVEVKINGLLSKEEKEKCKIYLQKEVFREIWVAKKKKEKRRVHVEYIDFKDIEKRMKNSPIK